MSWSKTRTSRWSNLKTEKPSIVKRSPEPLKTNSRWASLKSEPSPKRERMRSGTPVSDKPVSKRWNRTVPKEEEKTWEQIINSNSNNNSNNKDDYEDIINPSISKEHVAGSILNLKHTMHELIRNRRKYSTEIEDKIKENEDILVQRDTVQNKLKRFKLYDYEDRTTPLYSIVELNKKNNSWAEFVKNVIYEPGKSGRRGRNMKREAKGLSFADCLDRARHIIKNQRESISEEVSLLKKRYIENDKIITKNKKFLISGEKNIQKIKNRLDELVELDRSFDDVPYVKKITFEEDEKINIDNNVKKIQRKWREYSYKPWWTPSDNHIRVRFKNWNINIEKILENKYLFSEEEESEEETTDEEVEEVKVPEPEIEEAPPLNPYAELDEVSRNKKIKFYKKKLRQIDNLEKRDTLDREQKIKIAKRGEFEGELKLLLELDNSNI